MTDYIAPGVMTDPGEYTGLLDGLPGDAAGVARVVQGLMIHEFLPDHYGVTLTDEQKQTVHLRKVSDIIGAVLAIDDRPLGEARPPEKRLATNCRGYTVLAETLLRHAGVPARARCGFGAYFGETKVDHWVVEFHDGERWRMLDAQIDDVLRASIGIGFDTTDVTRDQFVIAGDAWQRCRAGKDDPKDYGLPGAGAGYWWIAGNMLRDAAALNDVEALPWDCWDPMPGPEQDPDWDFFEGLAKRTVADERDPAVRVPAEVFNAVKQQVEPFK